MPTPARAPAIPADPRSDCPQAPQGPQGKASAPTLTPRTALSPFPEGDPGCGRPGSVSLCWPRAGSTVGPASPGLSATLQPGHWAPQPHIPGTRLPPPWARTPRQASRRHGQYLPPSDTAADCKERETDMSFSAWSSGGAQLSRWGRRPLSQGRSHFLSGPAQAPAAPRGLCTAEVIPGRSQHAGSRHPSRTPGFPEGAPCMKLQPPPREPGEGQTQRQPWSGEKHQRRGRAGEGPAWRPLAQQEGPQ